MEEWLKNARLYARVSTDDPLWQDPDRQLLPLRGWCAEEGFAALKEYVDRESGNSKVRPQFRRMLHEAQPGELILVYSIDRFARFRAIETMFLLEKMKERKLFLKSITEHHIDTRFENEMMEPIVFMSLWFARRTRQMISENVKSGIASKKAKGEWHGGRPKGSRDSKPRIRRYYSKRNPSIEEMLK